MLVVLVQNYKHYAHIPIQNVDSSCPTLKPNRRKNANVHKFSLGRNGKKLFADDIQKRFGHSNIKNHFTGRVGIFYTCILMLGLFYETNDVGYLYENSTNFKIKNQNRILNIRKISTVL